MSDELVLFEFLEGDYANNLAKKYNRRITRSQSDPFLLEDQEFIRRYRLSKQLTVDLCDELRPMFREPVKATDLSVEEKILTALSFYATGSYQRPIGDIGAHSMAQQTVSSALAQVTAALNCSQMRRKYIVFPRTLNERNSTRAVFYHRFGIPGVLGCIDCTQVAIVRPHEHEERYYCRKHYHSLNVQLICNADMQIMSVDSSFGGATHDSFIWNGHPINLEGLNEQTWLLGDSGYPLRRNLMTPVVDAAPGTPERHYTDMHVRTRNIVERTIGLLKARFRCLLVHRVLHYKPDVAASIVNACVILHNICNKARLPEPTLEEEEAAREVDMQVLHSDGGDVSHHNQALQQGQSTRAALIRRLMAVREA